MPKVLLVEDDNNLREIFQMRLQAEGYSTVVAADGEEGLTMAMKEKPDLLIADVMMPKLSGFEMVENLRAAPETKDIKVIMMTALGQAEDQARGEKLGVLKYLVKSQVTLEDFARVVKEALGPGSPNASAAPQPGPAPNNNQQGGNPMQDDQTTPAPAPDAGAPAGDGAMPAPAADPSAPAGDGAMPAPAADPSAPAGDAAQTTAQEAGAVQDKVNDFAAAPAADVPPPADPAAPAPEAPAGGDVPATPPVDTNNAL
jgi:CheY-like chemotaxis protein